MCFKVQTPDVQVSVRRPPDSSERTSLLFRRLHRDFWQKSARFDIEYGAYYLDLVEQEIPLESVHELIIEWHTRARLIDYYSDPPYQLSLAILQFDMLHNEQIMAIGSSGKDEGIQVVFCSLVIFCRRSSTKN
jgi:hypothetical protein